MKIYPPARLSSSRSYAPNQTDENPHFHTDRFNTNDAIVRWRLFTDDKIRSRSLTTILIKKYSDKLKCKILYCLRKRAKQSIKDDSELTAMYCYYVNTKRILKKWKGINQNTKYQSELALLELGTILHVKIKLCKYFKKWMMKWDTNRLIRYKTTRIVIMKCMIVLRNGYFHHGVRRLRRFMRKAHIYRMAIYKGQCHHDKIKIKKVLSKWRRWLSKSLFMKKLIQVVHSKLIISPANDNSNIKYDVIVQARKWFNLLYRRIDIKRTACEKTNLVHDIISRNATLKYFGLWFLHSRSRFNHNTLANKVLSITNDNNKRRNMIIQNRAFTNWKNAYKYRQKIGERNSNSYNNLILKYTEAFDDPNTDVRIFNPLLELKLKKWIIANKRVDYSKNDYRNRIRFDNALTHAKAGRVLMLLVTLDTLFGYQKRVLSLSKGFSSWVRLNTNTIIATCIQKIYRGYRIRQRPSYQYLQRFALNIPKYLNFRRRQLRRTIMMILLLNLQNNNDTKGKKMLTIKKFLCFQKLHAFTINRVNNKKRLLNHTRRKKKAAFITIHNQTILRANCKNLISYAVKYRKRRAFYILRHSLGLLEASMLPLAISHYRKRVLLSSLNILLNNIHANIKADNTYSRILPRMKKFKMKRSWNKLSYLTELVKIRISIVTFCETWHLEKCFKRFKALVFILMRRTRLISRRMDDIANYKLIMAFLKLKRYKRIKKTNASIATLKIDKIIATVQRAVTQVETKLYQDMSTPQFGSVIMRTCILKLHEFSKASSSNKRDHHEKFLAMSARKMSIVFKRLRLCARYNKRCYVSRLVELARLYIDMLFYDRKKRVNRSVIKGKAMATAAKDSTNYNFRRKGKYLNLWTSFVVSRISNRLKCAGSHRCFSSNKKRKYFALLSQYTSVRSKIRQKMKQIRLQMYCKPAIKAWTALLISIVNSRYTTKFKFMKMWKLHNVTAARLKLVSRYVNSTIAKRFVRDCLHAWLVLAGKKLEEKKSDRVTVMVAHRVKVGVFNQWYNLAVASETRRTFFSLSHFQAWVKYVGWRRKKGMDFKKANRHYTLKLYQKGMRRLYKYHCHVGIHLAKISLTFSLRRKYRMRATFRKMLIITRFKRAIKMTERTLHYWKHISYVPANKGNVIVGEVAVVNPNIYTNDDNNISRIHKMRLFTQWKKFVRTALMRKIRLLIKRWRIVTIRMKKVTIAAVTKFTDSGNKIRKYNAFCLLHDKVSMIQAWKKMIGRWRKPLIHIDKLMRLTLLLTRFRLWYLAVGPARIVEGRRILRRRFRTWRNGWISYAFYRLILMKKSFFMLKKLKMFKRAIVKEGKKERAIQIFLSKRITLIRKFYLHRGFAIWKESLTLDANNNNNSTNNDNYENDYSYEVFDTYDEDNDVVDIDTNASTNSFKLNDSNITNVSTKVSTRWKEEISASRLLYRSKIAIEGKRFV